MDVSEWQQTGIFMQFDATGDRMFRTKQKGRPGPSFAHRAPRTGHADQSE